MLYRYADFAGATNNLDKQRLEVLASTIAEIRGCTDPKASNFNSVATLDDGSCSFTPEEDATKRVSLADYI